ncbi:hypothetical protein EVAR_43492_1 [Eumeta japonica]|uniref:Uncharacterized protein n=1 Tax=Eumeta variegata TaxID=151549 RepID=A0A4C1YHE6_EUMVA|nr:hypothetical protein EVAR_43492_1 [Eumeta japonica]
MLRVGAESSACAGGLYAPVCLINLRLGVRDGDDENAQRSNHECDNSYAAMYRKRCDIVLLAMRRRRVDACRWCKEAARASPTPLCINLTPPFKRYSYGSLFRLHADRNTK